MSESLIEILFSMRRNLHKQVFFCVSRDMLITVIWFLLNYFVEFNIKADIFAIYFLCLSFS